jgi:cyclopropane-fatty-acyl-phospholipid synthase
VFLHRYVFPGGELPHLSEVVREAEKAGFEVRDIENLWPHYARTCREWVERLTAHADASTKLVGTAIHRIWLLYLAASALSLESGQTEIHRVLLAKRGSRQRHRTRRYV